MKVRVALATSALVLAALGCTTVDYVGRSYAPTTNVGVYFSEADVPHPFEVMGEARATTDDLPFGSPGAALQEKLLEEARARGADAILLGGLSNRTVGVTQQTTGAAHEKGKAKSRRTIDYVATTTTTTEDVVELRARLLKYRTAAR